jgi:PiT family inorganic phosphate transporter
LFSIVLLVLTFLAVLLVSGNNLSTCVGPAIGVRILSPRSGILLGATGFSLGLLVQGSSMEISTHILLPNPSIQLQSEALLVAIIIFVMADIIRVPISLSMSLVGLLAGLSVARSMSISNPYLTAVVAMWFVAPAAAIVGAFFLTKIVNKTSPENIWRRTQAFRIILVTLSFTTSYALGANTLGLIVATGGFSVLTLGAAIVAIFLGSLLLSAGEIRRVSQELYLVRYPNATVSLLTSTFLMELATTLNIPLSNTQTLSAAVFGAAFSYRVRYISLRPFMLILAGWIVAPLLSFAIGLII